ncbi:MAG TPA: hypothetical protein VHG32_26450 [Thermoanaerobaculia bacterium]|nr:hypothetical protein [Thermoanaerobaculia bacterium]
MTSPPALPMAPQPDASAPSASGLFGPFNELLTRPLALVQRGHSGASPRAGRLFVGALACYVLYGLAAGCFAGGGALLLAAVKVPLVIVFTFVLCLPSLYVFGAMAGIEWSGRRLLIVTAGFGGTLGLLLAGLMPVAWLFSITSRYLTTVVWLHLLLWLFAVTAAWRFLRLALRETGARGVLLPWLLLFCAVSFQVATFFRPVLARDPGEAFFTQGKMSMFENFGRAFDHDDAQRQAHRPPAATR